MKILTLVFAIVAVLSLAGCSFFTPPRTRLTIPVRALVPDAPPDAGNAEYESSRNVRLTLKAADGTELEIVGDSSSVVNAQTDAIVGIVTASGALIPVAADAASKAVIAP